MFQYEVNPFCLKIELSIWAQPVIPYKTLDCYLTGYFVSSISLLVFRLLINSNHADNHRDKSQVLLTFLVVRVSSRELVFPSRNTICTLRPDICYRPCFVLLGLYMYRWYFVLWRTFKKKKIPWVVLAFFVRSNQHNLDITRGKRKISNMQLWVTKKFGFIFSSNTRQQTNKRQGGKAKVPVLDHVLSLIQLPENEDVTDLSQPWVALVILPHIR